MANRYDWLIDQAGIDAGGRINWTEDRHPAAWETQGTVIIAALGDWIEAQLAYVDGLRKLRPQEGVNGLDAWAGAAVAANALMEERDKKLAEAKARAIEAGYVWRLDLDP